MTDLPPYSGDTPICPKCMGSDAGVDYQRGIPTIVHGNGDHTLIHRYDDLRECLLRTCRDCGWAWLEACADAELATEISTPTGKLGFTTPLTRAQAEDYAARFTAAPAHTAPDPMRSSG